MDDYIGMLFLALAATVVGTAYFTSKSSLRKCLSLRMDGIRFNRLTKQLLLDLQQHRGMVNAFLSGDSSFKPKIEQKQTAIGQDITALEATYGQGLMTAKRWQEIRSAWQALRAEAVALPAEDSFRRHSELIRAVLYSMGDIAERSQIVDRCTADSALVAPCGASSPPLRRAWAKRGEWAPAWRQKAIAPVSPGSSCVS